MTEHQTTSEQSILCVCPNCESGSLIEHKFSWICECDFKLYKQQHGRKMSRQELHQLATTGTTELLQDFVSKAKGTKYAAMLKLVRDENDQMQVRLSFPENPEWQTVECPCCSGSLKEKKALFECECGFKLWKKVSGKELTEKQISDLLDKGITEQITGFTSKAGKSFDARLKIDTEEKLVHFDF